MNALILIDFQVGFSDPVWGDRNNPQAEENTLKLLDRWRDQTQPIFHIKHVSTEPGSPLSGAGTEFKAQLAPLQVKPSSKNRSILHLLEPALMDF